MLNIFISDLTEYNNGRLTGQWHDLETEDGRESAQAAVDEIIEKDHEHFISDYETDYLKVGEFSDIETLCEAGEILEDETMELTDMVQEMNGHNESYEHLDVFGMEIFNDIMGGYDPEQIALKVHFGDFNPTHEYFRFDGYENLESLSEYEYESRHEDEGADIVSDWLHFIHHVTV